MTRAHVVDGRRYAADLKRQLAADVRHLVARGGLPGLATVLTGGSYPALAYERRVRTLAAELGFHYVCEHLAEDVPEAEVVATVGKLDADPRIAGILVLRPLPDHVSEVAVYRALDPLKDIEAVHPVNAGLLALGRPRYVPSTPASVFHLLDRYLAEAGHDPDEVYLRSNIVVVGRSNNVGKPALLLAQARNATVVSCDVHSFKAGLLYEHTLRADIVVVAAGVPGLVTAEHVKDGVIAIDVGINPVTDPHDGRVRLVGDLDFEGVRAKAAAVSPVPGGVGPITDVWLLRNTVAAAELALGVTVAHPSLDGMSRHARTASLLGGGDLSLGPAGSRAIPTAVGRSGGERPVLILSGNGVDRSAQRRGEFVGQRLDRRPDLGQPPRPAEPELRCGHVDGRTDRPADVAHRRRDRDQARFELLVHHHVPGGEGGDDALVQHRDVRGAVRRGLLELDAREERLQRVLAVVEQKRASRRRAVGGNGPAHPVERLDRPGRRLGVHREHLDAAQHRQVGTLAHVVDQPGQQRPGQGEQPLVAHLRGEGEQLPPETVVAGR